MRSSAGKQSWNTWAHISGQVVLFHPQSFWLTKGLKKPKRKYVLCSGSTFSPGFLIKDDFIVWLPIKVFVFLSSLSLGSVTTIHHFSTLVPHSYSHFSNLIFFLWSYYFHFSAHKLNQSIFCFAYSSHSRAELFGMESHLRPQSFLLFHALMTRSPGHCEKSGLCELSILSGFCSRQTSCRDNSEA